MLTNEEKFELIKLCLSTETEEVEMCILLNLIKNVSIRRNINSYKILIAVAMMLNVEVESTVEEKVH